MLRKTMLAVFVLSIPNASFAQNAYLCAKAGAEERMDATQRSLDDSLWSSVVSVKGVGFLCGATSQSSEPDIHQVGYKSGLSKDVVQDSFVRSDHVFYDQFGQHSLSITKPDMLLTPSAM